MKRKSCDPCESVFKLFRNNRSEGRLFSLNEAYTVVMLGNCVTLQHRHKYSTRTVLKTHCSPGCFTSWTPLISPEQYSMEPQANITCDLEERVRRHATCRCDFFPLNSVPKAKIKQTCWNVNGTWLSWLSLHSRLLCCTAVGPIGTAALLGVFQTIQTTFPLCWASRAWVDGVSRRAVLFLLLLISALNWKIMSRLKGICLV